MEASARSLEAAAQVQAADLGLELKCSTAVWLVSVPWLMSCGTGWYLASRWHPHSDQSTVSKCFLTKIPPAPLSCCYKQLPTQHVDCSALYANLTFHQSTSTITRLFILDTGWLCYFLFTCQFSSIGFSYKNKKKGNLVAVDNDCVAPANDMSPAISILHCRDFEKLN